jgi:dephospho-CoA kinase
MIRIGLTGGIASGKSKVSEILAGLGAHVVDHDILARDAVALGTPGLAQIQAAFGDAVLHEDGTLNRPALGAIVFGDNDKLAQLNAIVHPEVKRLASEADERAASTGNIVVHDIPLLVETTQTPDFDAVLVVEAPLEQRYERMEEYRGMTREQSQARIAQQASDAQRRAIADYVIVNDGSVGDLTERVTQVWAEMTRRFPHHNIG